MYLTEAGAQLGTSNINTFHLLVDITLLSNRRHSDPCGLSCLLLNFCFCTVFS